LRRRRQNETLSYMLAVYGKYFDKIGVVVKSSEDKTGAASWRRP
jgi:hypothetical protein